MRSYLATTAAWGRASYCAVCAFVGDRRRVVAFFSSLVFQCVFLMILAFLFFPALSPGDDLSLDGTFGESELLTELNMADAAVEVDGVAQEMLSGPSPSATAVQPNQPVSNQPEVKTRSKEVIVPRRHLRSVN